MKRRSFVPFAAALLLAATVAHAKVATREITYRVGDTDLQGYVAWNDAITAKRPGVLIVHEWWGHTAHVRRQAERLARAGYVGFALDMYGKGKVAAHPDDAQKFMQEATKDPEGMKARFEAGLEQLKADPHVDTLKLAAIGYCFGGGVVLDQARAGANLAAVATFHGALGTEHPATRGSVKARILIMTGTADPFVTADAVAATDAEFKAAGADYRIVRYPGAKHAFTNPDAGSYGMPQLAYNAAADKASWAELLKFFKQVFK